MVFGAQGRYERMSLKLSIGTRSYYRWRMVEATTRKDAMLEALAMLGLDVGMRIRYGTRDRPLEVRYGTCMPGPCQGRFGLHRTPIFHDIWGWCHRASETTGI